MIENEEVLTTNEVAEFLKISRQTIVKMIKEKTIPGKKIGGRFRIIRSDLIKHLVPEGGELEEEKEPEI